MIPKPAAVPEARKFNSVDQLILPLLISIEDRVPSESAKKILFELKAGSKFPISFSPL